MNKIGILTIGFFLLLSALPAEQTLNRDEEQIMAKAYQRLQDGDGKKDEANLEISLNAYLESAQLYEKILLKIPNNPTAKQNHKYCLGQRGYIQIIRAQKNLEEKKWSEAAVLFDGAIQAYKLALSKIPNDAGFKGNLHYAQLHGGTAKFQSLLEKKGPAPEFGLEDFNKGKIELKSYKGKVVLLIFWTGWCPSCKEILPTLAQLQKEWQGKPFQTIAIAMDRVDTWKRSGSEEKARSAAQTLSFPAAWGEPDTCFQYGSFPAVPTLLLIGKTGNLIRVIPYEERGLDSLRKIISPLL